MSLDTTSIHDNLLEEYVHLDLDGEDDFEVLKRRLATYSSEAIWKGRDIDAVYVQSSIAEMVTAALDRQFQLSGQFSQPIGSMIIGPTGSGKTTLGQRFVETQPGLTLYERGYGAVQIRLSRRPTAGQIVGSILAAYKYPLKSSARRVYSRLGVAMEAMQQRGTRMLFIDEAHHLVHQMRRESIGDEETEATDVLRAIMDESRTGIVLLGRAGLKDLSKVDAALADRILQVFELKYFEPNLQWLSFVKSFADAGARTFGLEKLLEKGEPKRLHLVTNGNMRRFKRMVTEAVMIAVDAKRMSLSIEDLALAFTRVFGADHVFDNPYL